MSARELDFIAMLSRGGEDIEISRSWTEDDGQGGTVTWPPAPIGTRRLRVQRLEPDPRRNITFGGAVIISSMRVFAEKGEDILEADTFDRDGKTWVLGPIVQLRDHGDAYGLVALAT